MLPKRIYPDILLETIVQMRFSPISDNSLWAGILLESMGAEGYVYSSPNKLVSVDERDSSIKAIFLKDALRVLLDEKAVYFNCDSNKYLGWEKYIEEIEKVCNILLQNQITDHFERVALRYISKFDGVNLIDHLEGETIKSKNILNFSNKELKLEKTTGSTKIYISIPIKRDAQSIVSYFDINLYTPVENNEFVKALDKTHSLEKECFFGLLSDDFIKTLNPEY